MGVGDLERAVRECVNDRLVARGYSPPFDTDGTMSGAFQYTMPLISAFHSKVRQCLAGKGYTYNYDTTTPTYFQKTLAMKLGDVTVAIEDRTTGPGTHFKVVPSDAKLQSNLNVAFRQAKPPARKTEKGTTKKTTAKSTKKKNKKSARRRSTKSKR